jgi:hypothetical protein
VSFLLAEGHKEAHHYPIGMLSNESLIAQERINAQSVTEAILVQAAVSSLLDKKGQKAFKEIVKKLTNG